MEFKLKLASVLLTTLISLTVLPIAHADNAEDGGVFLLINNAEANPYFERLYT